MDAQTREAPPPLPASPARTHVVGAPEHIHVHSAVAAPHREPRPLRVERESLDALSVPREHLPPRARRAVPDAARAVVPARSEPPPVGREERDVHGSAVVREAALRAVRALTRVPDAKGLVPGGRSQPRAVGGPREGRDAPRMSAECREDVSVGHVEDDDGVARGGGGEVCAVVGEREVDEPRGAPVRDGGVVVGVVEEDGAV